MCPQEDFFILPSDCFLAVQKLVDTWPDTDKPRLALRMFQKFLRKVDVGR